MNFLVFKRTLIGMRLPAFAFFVCLALSFFAGSAIAAPDTFAPLKERLVREGFGRPQVSMLFQKDLTPMFKTVSQTLRMRESQMDYDQFLTPSAVAEAQRFLKGHQGMLAQAEEAYGVDRSVIVAILLVETHFGSYTGKTPTLAILSTFALMDQKSFRDKVWGMLPAQDRKKWDRVAFDQKLTKRAEWAYQELCALLQLVKTQSARAESFKGSVMGAIGWPQFLPSSLVRYGVDGDRDGRIDLFQPRDAVFSVANYLRAHGWSSAKTQSEQEEVIYTYNHSRPYVRTILELAARVRPEAMK